MTSFADTNKAALWNSRFMFVFGSIQSDNSAVAASFVFTCSHVPILCLCSTSYIFCLSFFLSFAADWPNKPHSIPGRKHFTENLLLEAISVLALWGWIAFMAHLPRTERHFDL